MDVKDSEALDLMQNRRQTEDQIAAMLRLLHKVPGVQLWFDINLLQSLCLIYHNCFLAICA